MDHEAGKEPSNEETRLAQIDDARHALDRARSIPEVRSVRDKSEAIRTYLKQQGLSLEAQNRAAELKVYAERRLGELLSRTVRRGGSPRSRRETSLPAGVNKTQSHRWQRLAAIPECEFDAHVAQTKSKGEEVTSAGLHRLARELDRAERIESLRRSETSSTVVSATFEDLKRASDEAFRTVYADPPWDYDNRGTRGAATHHYPTMSIDEICALPVPEIVADDAHLHLWTTNAFLFESKRVMEAWGFEFRSCFVWVKPQIGLGNYWRVSHEFLLLGVRGSLPFLERNAPSWVELPRTAHSAKPEEIRAVIERVSPAPRLELFARSASPGWCAWGNEVAAPPASTFESGSNLEDMSTC